jgi:hypothetical protein
MIETIVRGLVIAQPFVWIMVMEEPKFLAGLGNWRIQRLFKTFVPWAMLGVLISDLTIGFYDSQILANYILLVYMGVFIIRDYGFGFRECLALSFLIAYLNSWYWEGVLHLWVIAEAGLNFNQLFQMLHLIPGIYFLIKWEFHIPSSAKEIMRGWLASGFITGLRFLRVWKYIPMIHTTESVHWMNHGLMVLNRVICFWFLVNAIVKWGKPVQDLPPELPHYRTRF